MSDIAHDPRRTHWLRRTSEWLARKPETTAWVAVSTSVILLMEIGDHLLHWW